MLWDLAGLVLRSSVLLLVALLLRRYAIRLSPGQRHRLLLTALVLLLGWPILTLITPQVFVPLRFSPAVDGTVTVQQIVRSGTRGNQFASSLSILSISWLIGVCLALLPLAVGYLRAWRLRRRSTPMNCDLWQSLGAQLAAAHGWRKPPSLFVAPEEVMPQTLGLLRPSVLLPPSCREWHAERRRAVLLHEFAHIARRDTYWHLVANLAAAAWWFQPLSWITRRRLRSESEFACDAAVLASGMTPSVYAAELLGIAQSFGASTQRMAGGILMAEPSSLEWRLKSVLESQSAPQRNGRAPGTLLALCLAGVACSSLSVAQDGQLFSKGGVSMRRTLFAGLLTSASLSAAAIGGSVLDPAGAAVPDAKASLYNPDTKARHETVSVGDGKFAFDHLQAGQYILRVEKPGFAPVLREFNVAQNATVERGFTLYSDSSDRPASVAPSNRDDGSPIRVGGEQQQAKLVTKVQPVYPLSAKQARLQGKVMLEAVIASDGTPKDIQVISSPGEDLSQSALEAVRQWRYDTTLLNGRPVEVVTEIRVNYTLAP